MRMQIIAFFILTCFYAVGAARAQQVTLAVEKVKLEEVFRAIRNQTGYHFNYRNSQIDKYSVSFTIKNATIEKALVACLSGLPLGYEITDKVIIIKPSSIIHGKQQPLLLTGRVTNEKGDPLAGVTVHLKGSQKSTVTDFDGKYNIYADPDGVVEFSMLGYHSLSVGINGQSQIDAIMSVQVSTLDEVVAKGYYNTTRQLNTGNVSSITSEVISRQPVSDPLMALEGRVPGLNISQSSGVPGSEMKVQLRGQNSLRTDGNSPLYIIDGVPFNSQSLYTGLALGVRAVQNLSPFSVIRTADIEKIEILKDADATAIYGSRGANGVVLITTKRGKTGKTNVNFNISHGIGKVSNTMNLLNTQEYMAMRRQAYINDGTQPGQTDYDINGAWDTTRYTDWQKEMIGGTANITDAQISFGGGNEQTQFQLGGGYRRETTVYPGKYSDNKASAHFNINHKSDNKRFSVGASLSYMNDINKLPLVDFTSNILLAPNAPAIYNSDGSLNWQNSTWQNPLAGTLETNTSKSDNIITSANLYYQILKNLKIGVDVGYNEIKLESENIQPLAALNPANNPNPNSRRNSFGNNKVQSWIIEPNLLYNFSLFGGAFETLIGATLQQNTLNGRTFLASGFTSDNLISNVAAASTIIATSTVGSRYRYNALYGRIGYNHKDKYLLNLTARRDGSSRFGPGRQFGNFGAVGAAWIFTNEDFITRNLGFLSFGKLRASYGITGNDQIGDYKFLNTYTPFPYNYQGGNSLVPTSLTNPDYSWETVKKMEASLDIGILKNRIQLSTSIYRHRTSNQLVGYSLPDITGFPSVTANLPAVIENKGLEIELSSDNVQRKDFKWTSSFNISFPRNKLLSYPDIEASSYSRTYAVGEPLSVRFLLHKTGIDPSTGLYAFEDFNKDGQITTAQDRRPVFVGQKYYGGLDNSFVYKQFQVSIFFQFVKQTGYDWVSFGAPGRYFSTGSNQKQTIFDAIRDGAAQRFTTASTGPYSQFLQSDGIIVDASFIRLKNVYFAWSIPDDKLHFIRQTRLFLQAQNLLTITNYKGLDPETTQTTATSIRLPSLRILSVGVEMNF